MLCSQQIQCGHLIKLTDMPIFRGESPHSEGVITDMVFPDLKIEF